MKTLIISFIFLTLISSLNSGDIIIDKAGDNWDYQVYEALTLIKKTDINYYNKLNNVCHKITFWSGGYSTNEFSNGKGIIIISVKDAQYKSINNIAAIIIHESEHLHYRKQNLPILVNEELYCYLYEYNFLKKIHNVEPFLLKHCEEQIKNYLKKT